MCGVELSPTTAHSTPSGTCRQASSIAAKDAEVPSATACNPQEVNTDITDDKTIAVIKFNVLFSHCEEGREEEGYATI